MTKAMSKEGSRNRKNTMNMMKMVAHSQASMMHMMLTADGKQCPQPLEPTLEIISDDDDSNDSVQELRQPRSSPGTSTSGGARLAPNPAASVPAAPVPAAPVPGAPMPAAPLPAAPVLVAPVPATPVPAAPIPAAPVPAALVNPEEDTII
jgi:hypothetical protein